tara:strand:+ start:1021 stop:1737 length:717 start_codon:yes stop_codon:yes gene_type:complete
MENFNKFKEDLLCIICAKSNSEGLKLKNIKRLNGKPLIYFAIEKAKKNNIKNICVSTESNKISNIVKKQGIKVFFKRSKKLCKRNISKLLVWKDALLKSEKHFKKNFKYILDIEVTNPLINHKDLNKFLKKFYKNNNYFDGQFCTTPAKKNPYFNLLEYRNKKFKLSKSIKNAKITSRQSAPKTFEHVAALYCLKRDYLLKCKWLFEGKLSNFHVPLMKSFDIDTKEDFTLVKKIFKN